MFLRIIRYFYESVSNYTIDIQRIGYTVQTMSYHIEKSISGCVLFPVISTELDCTIIPYEKPSLKSMGVSE